MNIKEVKDLIQDVLQSDISEFELEHMGTRVRLKRGFQRDSAQASPESAATRKHPPRHLSHRLPPKRPSPAAENTGDAEEDALHMVIPPLWGPFIALRIPNPSPMSSWAIRSMRARSYAWSRR